MDKFFVIVAVLFIILFFWFTSRETKEEKEILKQNQEKGKDKVIMANIDLKNNIKKINLTNFLLILINVLLIVIIYQLSEIKNDIPRECGAEYYLIDTNKKLDEINQNLNNIDYSIYKYR